jgi:hypothetical protein
VKVKAIEIQRSGLTPDRLDVENAIQEWLDDDKDVGIEHVAVLPIAYSEVDSGRYIIHTDVFVTIFYRD